MIGECGNNYLNITLKMSLLHGLIPWPPPCFSVTLVLIVSLLLFTAHSFTPSFSCVQPHTHCTHSFWQGRVNLWTWNFLFCSVNAVCVTGVGKHCWVCAKLPGWHLIWTVYDYLCRDLLFFPTAFTCPHIWVYLNFRVFWIRKPGNSLCQLMPNV